MPFKILVADDSKLVISLINNILSKLGDLVEIINAVDGKEAYDKSIHLIPDLILLDWQMPVKNGIETLIALKRNIKTKDIPVVMLTGQDNLEEAYNHGAIEFLRKPFEKVELLAKVQILLELRRMQRELEIFKNEENKN